MSEGRDYAGFLEAKRLVAPVAGIDVDASEVHEKLFPFQRDLVVWALRKGRCALFADTGLGKTFMQLEWARLLGCRTLIVAPLTVARQTGREAQKIGLEVAYVRSQDDVTGPLAITNYAMVHHFDPAAFGAVVLDESSILKAMAGKIRRLLTAMFAETPHRLCCTATPAPNDRAEIGNHAEFLGIMTRADMLASFFVHDDSGWRLKGHAQEAFYRWLASWSISLSTPSDLGYDDDGFILPALDIKPCYVPMDERLTTGLFFTGLGGIRDRQRIRRQTVDVRCQKAADLVNGSDEQWIIWCGLNAESKTAAGLIPDAVEVCGTDSPDSKAEALETFQDGDFRVLVTKPKIAGFGMNFQNATRMAFLGLSDSWEGYYQCIRRSWRFGQNRPVKAHIVLSEWEAEIYQNVMRKERVNQRTRRALIDCIRRYEEEELTGMTMDWEYMTDTAEGDDWTLRLGDAAERLPELEPESVGLSVFSPPFLSLYTYTPTERDVGNAQTEAEFYKHLGYVTEGLLRATMPGRHACVHVAQVPAMLTRDGYIGMKDFRGKTIRHYEDRGWIYHGEVCIDKDPQAQAIRTHSKGLAFKQLQKDSSWLRPALADFILVFRKPGDNPEPVQPQIDNDTWIKWARPVWYGIRETETLNAAEARAENDERHICPLQLDTIRRCLLLWSNEGDLICDPFAGIGSTGYVALQEKRRFTGLELKRSYYETAQRNLRKALASRAQRRLFTAEEELADAEATA